MTNLLPEDRPLTSQVPTITTVISYIEPSAQIRWPNSEGYSRGTGRGEDRLCSNRGHERSDQRTEAIQLHYDRIGRAYGKVHKVQFRDKFALLFLWRKGNFALGTQMPSTLTGRLKRGTGVVLIGEEFQWRFYSRAQPTKRGEKPKAPQDPHARMGSLRGISKRLGILENGQQQACMSR